MTAKAFNIDRSLNALLYVANHLDSNRRDIHKIFKILYFADMSHLNKYGRPITGDTYIAMKYGPVPSSIYDMVKIVRGDSWYVQDELKAFFSVNDKYLNPLREADLAYLSKSDIDELDEAIKRYRNADFSTMTSLSHGSAWKSAWDDPNRDEITVHDILKESGADEAYINYIDELMTAKKELGTL